MHIVDWVIMTLPLIICGIIAIYSRRYVRSVADFMAGGRGAGRFLICTAKSEQGSGAAVFVAGFQVFLASGFAMRWWNHISTPVGLLLMVTGFVIYRYRQTRAMTLGQFFEMRYSRNFRLFAGMLGFFAGLVNFGVIPAIGARFMVAFLNFPQSIPLGTIGEQEFAIPTFLLIMALFLTICVVMTTTSGQVSVLLTDCAEGMFSQLFYTFIAIALLIWVFDWTATKQILLAPDVKAVQDHKSLVDPFNSSGIQDFNISMVLIGILGFVYRCIAWQNSHAFNSSAASPHESRMGAIIGGWRNFAVGVMVTLLSVCAMTYFHQHQDKIAAALKNITDPATRSQMESPIALTMMLPTGVKGMLLAICLMGIIAGDGIHLHSWGSIFIQDVIIPIRQRRTDNQVSLVFVLIGILWFMLGLMTFWLTLIPLVLNTVYPESNSLALNLPGHNAQAWVIGSLIVLWGLLGWGLYKYVANIAFREGNLTPAQHVKLLRFGIIGVAAWAFIFGSMFPQTKYVAFWWTITEAIFVGGAGVCIIGGLYSRRGTTTAAWTAVIVGSLGALTGISTQLYYERVLERDLIVTLFGDNYRLNIPWICFWNMLFATACYAIVSLLTCRQPHNLDKLLHRGQYAVEAESEVDAAAHTKTEAQATSKILDDGIKTNAVIKKPNWLYRLVTFGIDEQFSRSDRWITIGITSWSMFWFTVFIVGTIWNMWQPICNYLHLGTTAANLVQPWSKENWALFWVVTGVYLPLAIGTVTTIWFTWGCTHDMVKFFRVLREERVDVHDDGTVVHGADDTISEPELAPQGVSVETEGEGNKVASK